MHLIGLYPGCPKRGFHRSSDASTHEPGEPGVDVSGIIHHDDGTERATFAALIGRNVHGEPVQGCG